MKLGSKAVDIQTGDEGTIVGIADYLYAELSYLFQPSGEKHGCPRDAEWLSCRRLDEIKPIAGISEKPTD